jgi:adenine-specific DNA-methyltransferase
MADYFDTVLKPRIQKVAFADEWRDGRPVLPPNGQTQLLSTGQSHMFQYIRLESYDDTFHNIRFRKTDGPQLSLLQEMDDYFLGYLLDHETAGSPTLLDVEQFRRPFDYRLLVTGNDGVLQPQPVDLVTTFNFLLGLAVQTIRHYEYEGNPIVRVTGLNPDGKQVCVLWRNVLPSDQLDAERDWILANVLHDVGYEDCDKLYVNGENTIPRALLTEEEFKRRMFEEVD